MTRVALFVALILGFCCSAGSRLWAGQQEAEELLKSKGLTQRMSSFCLADELELNKAMSGLRSEAGKRKKAYDDAQTKVRQAKKTVDDLDKYYHQCRNEYEATRLQLATARAAMARQLVERNNALVAVLDSFPEKMRQAEKALTEVRATAAQQREYLIEYVMQLQKRYDLLQDSYHKIAGDAEIQTAIAEYNAAAKRTCSLGPMKLTTETLKKLSAGLMTDTIPITLGAGGHAWYTFVTINGYKPVELLIDTGAGWVFLPYKMALEVGLKPGRDVRKVTCTLADGHTVEVSPMMANSIRVGKFTRPQVQCGVLPEDCPYAAACLGLSFLNNFSYKFDKTKGLLTLSSIDENVRADSVAGSHSGRADKHVPGEKTPRCAQAAEEAPAKPTGTPAEQVAKLLAMEGSSREGNLNYMLRNGRRLVFQPTKRLEAKVLQAQCGDPDEMHKCPDPTQSSSQEASKAAPWKVWIWGTTQVLFDNNGMARFVSTGTSDSQVPHGSQSAQESKSPSSGTAGEQLSKLLALEEASSDPVLHVKLPNGRQRTYKPTKRLAAASLKAQCGPPDDVRKHVDPTKNEQAAKDAPPWEIWSWGKAQVFVDDSGMTRYIFVGSNKKPSQK